MSQHDSQCKHRHTHGSHREGDKRLAAQRLKSQCELVNKIASIDIWATERLYDKWRHQAILDKSDKHRSLLKDSEPILRNYNASRPTCQRHGGADKKYLKASLAQSFNAERMTMAKVVDIGGHGGDRQQRRRAQSRTDELRREYERHQEHRKRPSQSGERTPRHSRSQYQQRQQQEPGRTSDIDWPESWPSIWGSTAPKCAHRASSEADRLAAPTQVGTDSSAAGCIACRTERHHRHVMTREESADGQRGSKDNRRRRQRLDSRSGQHRQRQATHPTISQKTVEAKITFNSVDLAGKINGTPLFEKPDKHKSRQRDESFESEATSDDNQGKEFDRCRLTSNSTKQQNSLRVHQQSSSPEQSSQEQARSRSIDQSTYTIVRSSARSTEALKKHPSIRIKHDEYEVATASRGYKTARLDRSPVEKSEHLQKPVMLAEQSTATRRTVSAATSATRTVKEGEIQRTPINECLRRHRALQKCAAASIACNNSLDCKTLQMLSTETSEREAEAQSGGQTHVAMVSQVKLSRRYRIAKCHLPEVKMQSNSKVNKSANRHTRLSDDDLEDIIHTHQEIGELQGIEPKTGSVSRYVQDEVLRAAKLVATMGFAGLVGSRPSDTKTDPSTTDTIDDADDNAGKNKDSLGELDDLEEMGFDDLSDDDFDEYLEDGEADSLNRRAPSRSMSRVSRKVAAKSRNTRQGGDAAKVDSSSGRQASKLAPKRLLPMTQCPITRHRIECFRTQSGRVKCYMTARHPVKCRVQGGRIVCRSTVNPEASHLPYPCNAAWQ